MNRLYLTILLFATFLYAEGQSILNVVRSKESIVTPKTEVSEIDDAVYALGTVKRNGWHYPLQIIDKKDIIHCPGVIVKLSAKDKNGHFTRIETIDRFGNPFTGAFSLSFQSVDGIDSVKISGENIGEIMARSAAMEFISDSSGKNLIKERVFDSDGNLLFTTSVFHPREGIMQTMAFDRFGALLQCGKDSLSNPVYPVEQTTLDKWGYDSVSRFFDHTGNPILNTDKAWIAITANDSLGNVVKKQSADLDGNLIIDRFGNCGWEYEYDSAGNNIKSSNRDNYWQPIPTTFSDKQGITSIRTEYDRYGRLTRQYFVDSDGNPDTTVLGTHEIRHSYGPEMSTYTIRGLSLEGKPSPIYTDGRSWATETYRYENGNLVEYHVLNVDGKPYSDIDYYSSMFKTYNSAGKLIKDEYFVAENGVEKIYFKTIYAPDSTYTQWDSGDYRIERFDKKGRKISSINYTSTGVLDDDLSTPKIITNYADRKKRCRITEKYYDSNNRLDRIEVTDIDSVAHAKDFYKLTGDSVVYEAYRVIYDPSFNESVAQQNITCFGKLSEGSSVNSISYNKVQIRHTPAGALSAYYGIDSAGNPYFYQEQLDDYAYLKLFRDDFSAIRFDVDNSIIDYYESTETDRPQALSIEVTDSKAYSSGICDSDIILQYGDYILDWDLRGISNAYGYWALKSVLNAGSGKELIVYRPENPADKTSGSIYRISLPEGTPSELGFKAHAINRTYPQVEIINSTVAAYNASNPSDTITSPEFYHYPKGASVLGFLVPPKTLSQQPDIFNTQIGDPAFLSYVDHPGFIGFDCLSFKSLYNLVKLNNFYQKQSERYGDDYVVPDYLTHPTYFVTTGNGELKSFQKQPDSQFWYSYFAPSSADSIRLLNLPVLKQTPEPYIGEFSLDSDMSNEQIDSLYLETYDVYMVGLNELAIYRLKEFAKIDDSRALELLAYCYGFGYDVPIDYEISAQYAQRALETGNNAAGYLPIVRHCIELGEFEQAKPYLEIMSESSYPALKKEALKTLSDEYFSRNDSITAFSYLNDYVSLLDINDPDDEKEIARTTKLYEEFNHPIAAKGLLNLGYQHLRVDLESETGCSFINRCYEIDSSCENGDLSLVKVMYVVNCFSNNFAKYPASSKFRDRHTVTVRISEDETSQAASIGWSGEYYLLKFGDWNIYSHSSIFTDVEKHTGEDSPAIPFEVVLMDKKGKIVSHTFMGKVGLYININSASPKEVGKIRKAYDKWLKKSESTPPPTLTPAYLFGEWKTDSSDLTKDEFEGFDNGNSNITFNRDYTYGMNFSFSSSSAIDEDNPDVILFINVEISLIGTWSITGDSEVNLTFDDEASTMTWIYDIIGVDDETRKEWIDAMDREINEIKLGLFEELRIDDQTNISELTRNSFSLDGHYFVRVNQ